jgi:hypothetical protein
MIKPAPPPTRGVSGLALLFCGVAAVVGLAFDLMLDPGGRFRVVAQPGGRAVLGLGVAAGAVLIGHAMRLLLARAPSADEEGER